MRSLNLRNQRPVYLILLLVCGLWFAGCREVSKDQARTLTIFHAGSLSMPFREVSRLFMQRHPGVAVRAEAAGSRDTARKVSDLHRSCDVLGSADYKVVDNLLRPAHARFNIRFAANEMVIAYTDHSRGRGTLSKSNWYEILLQKEVAFGRSDPNRDPCGYRTEMLFKLAEEHYGQPGLCLRLARKDGQRFIRPKETDLLALLQAGEIDYLFIYRSVAVQHGLEVLRLPDAINLSSPGMAERYHKARVKVTGRKPGQLITRRGEPIVYSVTIPLAARERPLAEAYLKLLLSTEGQALMSRNGQTPIAPALADGEVPRALKPLCRLAPAR